MTVENHVLIVKYVQCSIANLLCHTLKYSAELKQGLKSKLKMFLVLKCVRVAT